MKITVYGYFGKGNLGDEALAMAWRRTLIGMGNVELSAPPHMPRGDVVIFTGEPLQDRTSRRSLLFYALAILHAARRGHTILGAVGVDVRSLLGRRLLPRVLRNVDYVSVRDPCSRELLKSLGVEAREFRDAALLLSPEDGSHGGQVLLNLVPGLPAAIRAGALRFAGEVARRLNTGLMGLVMAKGEDERAMRGLRFVIPRTVDEALEMVAGAALLVGSRLHALEFSLLCGTPFVAVPYAPKVNSFVELVDRYLPESVPRLPGTPAATVVEHLFSSAYREGLRRAREGLRAEAREGVEDVVRFLHDMA